MVFSHQTVILSYAYLVIGLVLLAFQMVYNLENRGKNKKF